jgi:Zn-dependent alcohol dehydrogenase
VAAELYVSSTAASADFSCVPALVFGCGGVGLCIVQGARIAGAATIIAVDTNSRKLGMASDLAATHCLTSPEDPKALVAEVKKILPRGVDVAFDAVGGAPDRLHHLMAATDLGGMTVAVGVLGWTDDVPVKGIDLLYGARRLAGVRAATARLASTSNAPSISIGPAASSSTNWWVRSSDSTSSTGLGRAAARADHARTILKITPSLL